MACEGVPSLGTLENMLLDLVQVYLLGKQHMYVHQASAQMNAIGDLPSATSKNLMLPAI